MTDYKALIALAMERENDEWLGGLIGDLANALKSSIEERAIDEGRMAAQADELKDRIAAAERERDEAHAILAAADKGTPIYKAVERILDEHSAWIARPSNDVTKAIALAAGVAWMAADKISPELDEMDRALSEARASLAAAQAEAAKLRSALENIGVYGCGMLNQPAALNGPEDAWLRMRISEYERVAHAALAQGGRDDG